MYERRGDGTGWTVQELDDEHELSNGPRMSALHRAEAEDCVGDRAEPNDARGRFGTK